MTNVNVFMIDPPWPKRKGGIRKVRPNQGRDLDYKTMPVSDIFTVLDKDVFSLSSTCHTVFIWTVDKFIRCCEAEMEARAYRLHARMIWDKENGVAPAFSVRFAHEYLLWYYKPKFMQISSEMRGKYTTVMRERSRQHSRKPDIAYERIERMFPGEVKMDVFSREPRNGWLQFGDQADYFVTKEGI